jgi:hypothetical protein
MSRSLEIKDIHSQRRMRVWRRSPEDIARDKEKDLCGIHP